MPMLGLSSANIDCGNVLVMHIREDGVMFMKHGTAAPIGHSRDAALVMMQVHVRDMYNWLL